MKRKKNGVLYELVPEEKKLSCEDCAFKGPDRTICTTLTEDCNKGLIYKKVDEPISTSNLKPFNLEAAKAGKPVCTRDGRKARIICFDTKGSTHPIVALIEKDEKEVPSLYRLNGKKYEDEEEWKGDLMMLPKKKEGWTNVYNANNGYSTGDIYSSKEEAEKQKDIDCVATIKIEWEE